MITKLTRHFSMTLIFYISAPALSLEQQSQIIAESDSPVIITSYKARYQEGSGRYSRAKAFATVLSTRIPLRGRLLRFRSDLLASTCSTSS